MPTNGAINAIVTERQPAKSPDDARCPLGEDHDEERASVDKAPGSEVPAERLVQRGLEETPCPLPGWGP